VPESEVYHWGYEHALKSPYAYSPVYLWGLSDAVNPPFTNTKVAVYPLPPLTADELTPIITGGNDKKVYTWDENAKEIRQVDMKSRENLPEIKILYPEDKAILQLEKNDLKVEFEYGRYEKFEVVLLFQIKPLILQVRRENTTEDTTTTELPYGDIKDGYILKLYNSRVYWWVEARDSDNNVVAQSRLMEFELESGFREAASRLYPNHI
jgi:hypothetical protein